MRLENSSQSNAIRFSEPFYALPQSLRECIHFTAGQTTLWTARQHEGVAGFAIQSLIQQCLTQGESVNTPRIGVILVGESLTAFIQMVSEMITGTTTPVSEDLQNRIVNHLRVHFLAPEPNGGQGAHEAVVLKAINALAGKGCQHVLVHPSAINRIRSPKKRLQLADKAAQLAKDCFIHLHWVLASSLAPAPQLLSHAKNHLTWERGPHVRGAPYRFRLKSRQLNKPVFYQRKAGQMRFLLDPVSNSSYDRINQKAKTKQAAIAKLDRKHNDCTARQREWQ